MLSATVPRWWNVTPAQLHWVGLHMDYGETLLAEAALNPERRQVVLDALGQYAPAARVEKVGELAGRGPSENGARKRHAVRTVRDGPRRCPRPINPARFHRWPSRFAAKPRNRRSELNYDVISHAFGTPKPTLANSYSPELLNLRTFPTLMGYSSRILAESWESNLLYYAALADQLHLAPGAAERPGSGVDARDRGADLRHAPGRLAGAAAIAAAGGRRCPPESAQAGRGRRRGFIIT